MPEVQQHTATASCKAVATANSTLELYMPQYNSIVYWCVILWVKFSFHFQSCLPRVNNFF